jgi:AcrR family transcriptional regulator
MVEIRLNAEERREAILEAALAVFSRKGFSGTTTKDIAREAGVSEALLYRHFPSKEDLHGALQDTLCEHKEGLMAFFASEEPSTELLVKMHYLLLQLIAGPASDSGSECVSRLLLQNMLEDGKFARQFHEDRFYKLFPGYKACLDAAIQAGDIRETGVNEMESLWFLHHIAVMINMNTMPETPTFEYRKNTHALLEDVLRYSLRGIGMTDEAIKQHANPSQLARALDAVMQAPLSLDPR